MLERVWEIYICNFFITKYGKNSFIEISKETLHETNKLNKYDDNIIYEQCRFFLFKYNCVFSFALSKFCENQME